MRNIEYLFVLFFFLFSINLISQYRIVEEIKQIQELPSVVKDKLHDGLLIKEVIERNKEFLKGNLNLEDLKITVALYFEDFPKQEELQLLEQLNVNIYPSTWIPPLSNHPYGFMLADIYTNKFIEVLNIVAIKRIANTNEEYYPTDNRAAIKIRSDLVWLQGYTGTGVKVAVLDSGLDGFYEGTDLPNGYERRDYSNFPSSIDNNVENTVSGHGTHVAGSVLGRGLLSNNHNSSNGNTPFKGSAPNANLCFLKIGNDINASASANAMIAAIQSAVDTFNSKIISMSYGGWDAYHDGSSSIEQTIDWAFNRGVISFISAGNEGAARRHYSGTVNGLSYSAYIPITVTSSIKPVFNLVWFDGTERRNLTLKYYNSSFNEITQIQLYTTTESLRGTESQYSEALNNFSPGTYYLRVYNPSSTNTFFHLYGYYTTSVLFDASVADPNYTTNNPSNADYAISVGAYVSRFTWWNYLNNGPFSFTGQNGEDQIANFSSRGPRVDGINKPDIVAPGTAIISLRDTDVLTSPNNFWIDNDGINGGSVNYYVMQGTSMSCPITSGAAALYLNKYPSATPTEIKNALLNNTSKSLTESYPNPKWGYGKLDIFAAMNSVPVVDGHLNDPVYENLASFTSGRNGFGNDNDLKSLKYYTDGTSIYIGITGEITSTDNIVVFFNFSGYAGRGGNTLQNSGSDAGVFKHFSGAKMDFDVDFALAFNEGNSSTNFFIDACRYDLTTPVISSGYLGNVANQLGSSANFNLGSIFGGTGNMTIAYNSGFATDSLRGIELQIPISAFAGVTNTQSVQLFVIITNSSGFFSNECIPGDPGANNPGNNPDFSNMPGGPFHTSPSVLPIELAWFNSSVKNRNVLLSWSTISEINSEKFEIERSIDNDIWLYVGEVKASGNSNSFKHYSFTDENLNSGTYFYRLKMIDNDGSFKFSNEIKAEIIIPKVFSLSQNYPNPFNPATTITFTLSEDGWTTLKVFDILGREIQTLVNEELKAGTVHSVIFNGSELPSGIYLYRLETNNQVSVKKLILMK